MKEAVAKLVKSVAPHVAEVVWTQVAVGLLGDPPSPVQICAYSDLPVNVLPALSNGIETCVTTLLLAGTTKVDVYVFPMANPT